MDRTLIAALIGFGGALLAPLVSWLLDKKDVLSRLMLACHAIGGGILGVALGLLVINPLVHSPCPMFAPASAQITFPASGNHVPKLVTVQGTACHTEGKDLWVLVAPDGVRGYYPQNDRPIKIANDTDGDWSTSAYIGQDKPSEVGRGFVILIVLADANGSAALHTYFAHPAPMELPEGVEVIGQQIRVTRMR